MWLNVIWCDISLRINMFIASSIQDSLAIDQYDHQMEMKDMWRLVSRDVEADCLTDSQVCTKCEFLEFTLESSNMDFIINIIY